MISNTSAYTYGVERIEVEALDETRPESQDPLYYLYDGLGSVAYMVKPDGNTRDHYRYDEFGKPAPGNSKLSPDGAINLHNTFGYTGEMWDEESKLLYLRARYYEPETGRFLSKDTYEGEIENPLSKNLYAYVQNNPVRYKDPTGHLKQGDGLLPEAAYQLILQYSKEYDDAKKFSGVLEPLEISYLQHKAYEKAEVVRELSRSNYETEKIIYKLWLLSSPEQRIPSRKFFGGADTNFYLTLKRLRHVEKVDITRLDLNTLDRLYIDSENAQILAMDIASIATRFPSVIGKAIKLPKTTMTTKKLQHEWKHASDFGLTGNWNKANGELYQKAIQKHINTTSVYKSTYRGQDVYVYLNKDTRVGAYTDLTGNYIGGWKFSIEQLIFHLSNGTRIR